ncbi:Disease resistance protein RGA2 [Bienertia sinuspersici]
MRNLKGWWKQVEPIDSDVTLSEYDGRRSMQFSKLSKLEIRRCPNLRMLPLCPIVEDLQLCDANKELLILGSGLKLKSLTVDNVEELMSLPNHCLHQLSHLSINGDNKLQSSETLGEVFTTLSSSLQSLEFSSCDKLRSISKGLEHLTALENLRLKFLEELDLSTSKDGIPWKALNTNLRMLHLLQVDKLVGLSNRFRNLENLRSLHLARCNELKELPEWIDCLTSLEYLELYRCHELRYLPEAFHNLTSLNQLEIMGCHGLTERCQSPNGADLPKIQHIPLLYVVDEGYY